MFVLNRLEGTALARIPTSSRILSQRGADQKMLEQAAPGNYPARCMQPRRRPVYTRPKSCRNRLTVLGSRLSSHVSAGLALKRNSRARRYACQRPLQALGITHRRVTPTEDEDSDSTELAEVLPDKASRILDDGRRREFRRRSEVERMNASLMPRLTFANS
jgi:hypothetical protein